ncbi:MAG TPA: hypothetical protein VN903_11795, partial [Polyangia bacterium]|nr:hypothetical protein [Polyangia bacterium]
MNWDWAAPLLLEALERPPLPEVDPKSMMGLRDGFVKALFNIKQRHRRMFSDRRFPPDGIEWTRALAEQLLAVVG